MKRLVLLSLGIAGIAFAHEGGPGEGPEEYVPPPVEPVPSGHGFGRVARGFDHEVWLVDQSNSNGTFGGRIHIYDGEQLRINAATATDEVVDLGAATAALCMASTGVNPVRPHMLVFNRGDTHAVLAFVASGHVVIFDAEARTPLACFRTEAGAGGFRQAHAVWPTPDNTHILVANQNGKKFERIATDYANNVFVQEPAATLNLATCTTPNGLPCQDPLLRPDNAPICPYVPDSGFPAFLSLRGGGMLTVDPYQTPMQIIGEYGSDVVPRDGCGFIEARGYLYGNGGGGNVLNPDGWYLYRLPLGDASVYNAANPPNTPAAEEIAHDDALPRDAHGVAASRNEKHVWFFDRAANVVEIYDAQTGLIVKTENLVSPFSADPTPDLVGEAPDGKAVYASLRGPNPLSGDPHASTGSTPGLMVIEMRQGGKDLVVRGLAPISNIDAGGAERADGHGVRVRRTDRRRGCR